MNLTDHARRRMRQRGVRPSDLGVVADYGEVEQTKGAADKLYLSRRRADQVVRELQDRIERVRHASGLTLVLSGDDVVTAYFDRPS